MSNSSTPNQLINETSPYLLQHAFNPVKWMPWGNEALNMAREQNKPLIISVGYSACHWCHVMEKESFEDNEVAEIMNKYYVCVKVDREERPDVDNLYMTAVQLMTGHGGWPLNCIALPDGRPIYGGTYFNKKQWINILFNVAEVFANDREKVSEYAASLSSGIKKAELVATSQYPEQMELEEAVLKMIRNWKARFDNEFGGPKKVPKFPMPGNYLFLLRYAHLYKDREVLEHVNLTLNKMANGGIYDQLHGGFARYSTDGLWKLPHFEKMLYDNAQLLSLYSEAYRLTAHKRYLEIVTETADFVIREWKSVEAYFCSAYDADSEGEEGKYYVWTKEELREILKDNFELFSAYYQVNEAGYWENGNYILMRNDESAILAAEYQLSLAELEKLINHCKSLLRQAAEKRTRPRLDDKMITSWNALMIKGFTEAYLATGNERFKKQAEETAEFLLSSQKKENGELYRIYKNGQKKIEAFLDDYVFLIDALLALYSITANQRYLNEALAFTELVVERFSHPDGVLFYYTNAGYSELITRQSETSDNVIPSSNSQMAINLFYLGKHFNKPQWEERSYKMLVVFAAEMSEYGAGYSNWGCLALHFTKPFHEVVIVGKHVNDFYTELRKHYFTNAILVQSELPSELPLLKGREPEAKTKVFVCTNNTCGLPVSEVSEVLHLLEKN